MPHAYVYYFGPLLICGVFVLGGAKLVRKAARGEPGQKNRLTSGCGAILLILLGGTIASAVLFMSPTPWQRRKLFEHIFHTPPEQIVRVTLHPGSYRSLVASDVTITDPAQLRSVAQALNDAVEFDPSHPTADWTVQVELTTTSGTYEFGVESTSNGNGTLASVSTKPGGGGWHLGDFKVDGLQGTFERTAATARPATRGTP